MTPENPHEGSASGPLPKKVMDSFPDKSANKPSRKERKAAKQLGKVARSAEKPARSRKRRVLAVGAIGLALAGGAAYIAHDIVNTGWNNKLDTYDEVEQGIIEDDRIKKKSTCLSDGLAAHAGVAVRASPHIINDTSKLGFPLNGNVITRIEKGKTLAIRQPRLHIIGSSEWVSFTINPKEEKNITSSEIGDDTGWVNLHPYRNKDAAGNRPITDFDVMSTPEGQGFTMECQITDKGTTTANGKNAAFAYLFDSKDMSRYQRIVE